jgi:hypothetical protein
MMSADDLLGGYTCTPVVSQRSESGQEIILGAKTGKGMSYSVGLVTHADTSLCHSSP